MKNLFFNVRTVGPALAALFFVTGVSCSSDSSKQASKEANAPVMEESAVPQEQAPMQQDSMAQEPEEDVQVSNVPATPIKKPENKEPVLTTMSTSYKEWNKDGNNVLDKEEFYQGLYQVWDKDKNNEIGESEFTDGANNFFASYNFKEYGQYADWDTDNSGNLSVAEFREGMKNTVDQEPTAQNLLVIWDTDNDDAIERIELDNITVRLDKDSN